VDEVNTFNFAGWPSLLKNKMVSMQKNQNPGHHKPNQYYGSKCQVTYMLFKKTEMQK
jgi:hypothetical protein